MAINLIMSYESISSLSQWQSAASGKCGINEKNLKSEDESLCCWSHILCSGMKILELHKNILFFGKLIMFAKFFLQ